MTASPRWPVPPSASLAEGLDAYLARNGFSVDGYTAPFTKAKLGWLTVPVPNTPKHAVAIRLHDLHHVLTGYGTDLPGEGELSAWELRRGVSPLGPYVGGIVLSLALLGVVRCPRRTCRAFIASGTRHPSLFHELFGDYDGLLGRQVGELRASLGLPIDGICAGPSGRHTGAPATLPVA